MRYPIKLETGKDGAVAISFPDVPKAHTWADTQEEALSQAEDALESAIDLYFDERLPVPPPSKAKRGQPVVSLSASTWSKVILHNAMLERGVRPAELARRMGISKSEVTRVLNPRHATKIDTINLALGSLGLKLKMSAH